MAADRKPPLVEAAAVFSAVHTFQVAQGLPAPDAVDLPLHLEELKAAIGRVQATLVEHQP